MKNKILKIIGVLLIVLVALVYTLRSSDTSIKIGVIAPLSGEYATAGENMVKGINVALDEYKSKNKDVDIKIVVEDDGFNVGKGTSAYKKLIGIDKVDALITLSTPVIDAIHTEINKDKIPVMQIGIQTVGVVPDNIFQNSPAGADGIIALSHYVSNKMNLSKLAVVYDTTPGGTEFSKVFQNSYKKPFVDFSITKKDDIRSQVNKIIAGKFDSVVSLNSPENGALIVKELLKLGYKGQFIFDAQLQTGFADYKRILGDTNQINEAISFWFKDGDKKVFTEEFKAKYNQDPGFVADFGYDSFNTLMNVYSTNDTEWVSSIQSTNTSGASGKIAFDKNGVRKQDISINQVKGGEIVPIDVVGVEEIK
jgi:branched-chain amino acid transport system substrate-binding protein